MAEYQHASDHIIGIDTPFSGVIRTADGRWVATQALYQADYVQYLDWFNAAPENVPDPFLHPDHGGAVITLQEGEVPYGTMLDSLPLELGGNPPSGLPVNDDVPALTGTGVVGTPLTCTMGNWHAEPTSYTYGWVEDEVNYLGAADNTITPDERLIGHNITCIVTASNAVGSTQAPPSNAIMVVPAAGTMASRAEPARSVPRQAEPEAEEPRRHRSKE